MTVQELAKDLVACAKASSGADSTDDIQCGHTFNAVIVDYEEHFGKGQFNFRLFVDECDKHGYDVFPLDRSALAIFSGYLNGKIVVQSKEYRNGCDKGLGGKK